MTRWDDETDLLVVGYGGAGAAAAITGGDHGADVIVLEKQPAGRHTPSTKLGGGALMAVTDADKAALYLDRCAAGMVPADVSRAWAERAEHVLDWVGSVCDAEYQVSIGAEHPEFPGAEAVQSYVSVGHGNALFGHLADAVGRRGSVRVQFDSPASRLIRDGDERVVGVEIAGPGGVRRLRARQGVVLTCGGYEYADDMKRNYLKGEPIHFYGNPGNTGDGVRMAQAVGADLWHMNQMIGRGIAHFDMPDGSDLNGLVIIGDLMKPGNPPGYVLTDRQGRRFANEYMQAMSRHDFYYLLLNYDPATGTFPRNPCYWFFDERRMALGSPVATELGPIAHGYYDWSEGSEAEIERGWISRADSIEEAAAAAGVADPAQAAREVRDYNQACQAGSDPFGRPANSLVPLDSPPYYCMPLYPGGSNTSGGPRRNKHAQVLDVEGTPIAGLYEAGELGEPVGLMYPSNGANISDCLCFGQIAVEHALGKRA